MKRRSLLIGGAALATASALPLDALAKPAPVLIPEVRNLGWTDSLDEWLESEREIVVPTTWRQLPLYLDLNERVLARTIIRTSGKLATAPTVKVDGEVRYVMTRMLKTTMPLRMYAGIERLHPHYLNELIAHHILQEIGRIPNERRERMIMRNVDAVVMINPRSFQPEYQFMLRFAEI